MDNEALMMIARFTYQARKLLGPVDSNSLVNNAEYRDEVFRKIDAEADEDLLILALNLRIKLGSLMIKPEVVAPEKPKETVVDNSRYNRGARG